MKPIDKSSCKVCKYALNQLIIDTLLENFKCTISHVLPLRSEKADRYETLLGFARSHLIVKRGSVSLSCASTPHPSCFSKS